MKRSTYTQDGGMHYTAPPLTPTLSHPMGEGEPPGEPLTPTLSPSDGEREKHRRPGM
jgi:hypothetical protein